MNWHIFWYTVAAFGGIAISIWGMWSAADWVERRFGCMWACITVTSLGIIILAALCGLTISETP